METTITTKKIAAGSWRTESNHATHILDSPSASSIRPNVSIHGRQNTIHSVQLNGYKTVKCNPNVRVNTVDVVVVGGGDGEAAAAVVVGLL